MLTAEQSNLKTNIMAAFKFASVCQLSAGS